MIKHIAKSLLGSAVASAIVLSAGVGHAQEKIRMAYLPISDYVLGPVAQEKGFFKKHGLNVELQRVQLMANVAPAMIAGDLQVGIGVPASLLQAVDAGLDFVIIGGAARITKETNPINLIVGKDSGIRTPADLKGKRVALPGLNSSLDFFLRRWLEERGVKPEEIQRVELAFPLHGDALKSKQVDAAISTDPFLARIYAAGIAEKLSDFLPEVANNQLGNFWQSTRKWADSHGAEIAALRLALQETQDFLQANPAEAQQLHLKLLGLPARPVLPAWRLKVTEADLAFYVDLCRQYCALNRAADPKKLIVP